ncbi:MAG TPA: M18 family aminopeptidase [Ilumatobacter sp.]
MPPSIDDLRAFLDASPSPFHAARSATDRLDAAGFRRVDDWSDVPAAGYVVRDAGVVAWRSPAGAAADTPFRLAGAHTDSPCLRVKPRPDMGTAGWRQLNVEVYGGILNNSWLDRDLGVAGRLTMLDGTHHLVAVEQPIARVPQLAVHLDRGANDGLKLDPQQHLQPVWGTGAVTRGEFSTWIAEQAGVDQPAFWELSLYDVQPAAVIGADRSLLASGRLDNQVSCWAAIDALVAADPVEATAVVVLNDHEEVGSSSTTGAGGPLLERVLEHLVLARGGTREHLLRALAGSSCVSADNAHAVHPNYTDRHDPDHRPMVNAGPAIKINHNQRYATSSATAAMFRRACESAGVPHQVFVSRNNMPCGSTIGPITATRLGIDTVDVGVPQLSMHSARELCGTADPIALAAALGAVFA